MCCSGEEWRKLMAAQLDRGGKGLAWSGAQDLARGSLPCRYLAVDGAGRIEVVLLVCWKR